jgi:hypothetical protein
MQDANSERPTIVLLNQSLWSKMGAHELPWIQQKKVARLEVQKIAAQVEGRKVLVGIGGQVLEGLARKVGVVS